MLKNLPVYIPIVFAITTIATLFIFIGVIKKASIASTQKKATILGVGFLVWLFVQALLSLSNIYNSDFNSFPPKIMLLGIFPLITVLISLFFIPKGKQFIDSLPLKYITYLHVIRIPIEIVLYWLFLHKTIPEIMTFEGRNFDILAGITAPFIAYFGFIKTKLSNQFILIWNIISLALLLNIIFYAVLSTPSPVQKFAFEQPNVAILHFPFCWLPTFIVPIVLFGHLVSIRQLIIKK